jgi:hypothetical protein
MQACSSGGAREILGRSLWLGKLKAAELDFLLSELYRKAAVRYVLMGEDLERWPDPLYSRSGGDGASLWDRAERFLAESRQAS